MDDDECGAVGGMIGKGNRSTRRTPAPVPVRPPQIPHDLTRARTQAAAMENQHSEASGVAFRAPIFPVSSSGQVSCHTQLNAESCRVLGCDAVYSGRGLTLPVESRDTSRMNGERFRSVSIFFGPCLSQFFSLAPVLVRTCPCSTARHERCPESLGTSQ
jgi:hypothetical protein